MLVNQGKLNEARLRAGHPDGKKIASIGVGTSDTAATPADTALTGAVLKPVTNVVYLPGTDEHEFQATLDGSDPAMTIREMGLYNEDGVLCHRKVVPDKVKVIGLTYQLIYRVKII